MRIVLTLLFASSYFFGSSQEDCIDPSLIDPNAICTFEYNPVCGCDGVTYSNPCVAETTGGVTEFTFGECGTIADCQDLVNIDFGECEMEMGVALVEGECIYVSGCGWEVGGVDYAPFSFPSIAACMASCTEEACIDLAEIDFGFCDFPLGIALIDGECTSISGCDWEVGGIDYSPYFYENVNDCEACASQSDCLDLADIDFGECEMAMGIALINGECVAISGCGWEVGGVDYTPYSFTSFEDCNAACGTIECYDLAGIDFGPCDAVLGIGLLNGTCTTISGCDWNVGGIDYSPYFFESFEDCSTLCEQSCEDPNIIDLTYDCGSNFEPVCGCDNVTYSNACEANKYHGITEWTEGPCACPDPSVINQDILCTSIYDPVCGCDGVTYANACIAFSWNGITEWVPGECGMNVENLDLLNMRIFPNPTANILNIELQTTEMHTYTLFDLSGKSVLNGSLAGGANQINLSGIPAGAYRLKVTNGMKTANVPVFKID